MVFGDHLSKAVIGSLKRVKHAIYTFLDFKQAFHNVLNIRLYVKSE